MNDSRIVPITFTSDSLILKGVLHLPETLPAPYSTVFRLAPNFLLDI